MRELRVYCYAILLVPDSWTPLLDFSFAPFSVIGFFVVVGFGFVSTSFCVSSDFFLP